MAETKAINAYEAKPPTLWQRLGFGTCLPPNMDDLEDAEGFAPAYLETGVINVLDRWDRLRVLISGKVLVVVATKTDVIVKRAVSRSNVSILPPDYPVSSHFERSGESPE